jgi:hypothetical protein
MQQYSVPSSKRIRAAWLLYRTFEFTVTFIMLNNEEMSNNWQNSTDIKAFEIFIGII